MLNVDKLRQELETQDNLATADPLYGVQEKEVIFGMDLEYTDDYCWMSEEEDYLTYYAGDPVFDKLNERYYNDSIAPFVDEYDNEIDPNKFKKIGIKETWKFVTLCFTRVAAEKYIEANRHNLTEPRIYVYSAYRNHEMIEIRNYFLKREEEIVQKLTSDAVKVAVKYFQYPGKYRHLLKLGDSILEKGIPALDGEIERLTNELKELKEKK